MNEFGEPAEPVFTLTLERLWFRLPEHVRINDAVQEIPTATFSEGEALNVALNPSFETGSAAHWTTIAEPPATPPPPVLPPVLPPLPPTAGDYDYPAENEWPAEDDYPSEGFVPDGDDGSGGPGSTEFPGPTNYPGD